EGLSFNVRDPIGLCVPADKDGTPIVDSATSLERFKIQRVKGSARYAGTTRDVTTALGTLSLDTVKPDQLLVPTAESSLGAPQAVDPSSNVDRYKCYQVRVTKRTPKVPKDQQLVVHDSLASLVRRFQVKQPTRLCL